MRRIIFFLSLIALSIISNAQSYTDVSGYWRYFNLKIATGFTPPIDTLAAAPIGSIATKGSTLYVKNAVNVWVAITGAGGSGVWGAITGSIGTQTDLINLANSRMDSAKRTLDTLYAITDSTFGYYVHGQFRTFKALGAVQRFNGRIGAIILTQTDVITALGYTPVAPTDTSGKWVGRIFNNATNDSIIYYVGGTRYAIKDNGGGSGITQLTGPVTAGPGSGSQVTTIITNAITTTNIQNQAVTLAKIANGTANYTIGRDGSGNTVELPPDTTFYTKIGATSDDSLVDVNGDTTKAIGYHDSLDFHHVVNPNKSRTFHVQAHDTLSGNAVASQYRLDTTRTRINNALGLKLDSIRRVAGKDSVYEYYANGTKRFAYRDTIGTGGGGAPDSSVFVTSTRLNKNAAGADTLWHVVYGIPQPNGTGVNGTPITWSWLITGGEHAFSPDLDSCLFVSSSGHLQVGFATPMDVAVGGLFGDEQTFSIVWQVIGNNDNFDFGAWLHQSGIGANIVGSGAGGVWSLQGAATVGPYTFAIDTSTQGIVSFDLIDGNNQYLGATTNGATVVYNGSNGYSLKRLFSGLTRNYKYQILDVAGNPVIGQPAATDRLGIFLGISYPVFVDMRQFTSANQFYFGSGLPNMWFMGMIKLQPDSLKIIRPVSFIATALTSTTASIAWSAVSNAALGYQLDRSTNPNFSGSVTNLLTGAGTSFSDSGLTTGTIYYYRIRAIRASGQYSGWKLRQIITP